ncbi:MAG: transporter substrate-binding domain-containing protein [Alphaproteobacteria bacterium]
MLTAGAGLAAGSALVAAQSPQALAQAPAAIRSRLQTIQQNGTLRCGTTGDFNPMSFRDPATRELRGHQIDCANKLAADLGVKVEFVPTTWPTLISGLTANQYDIVTTGTSMSVARMKASGFTIPWGRNAFLPLARKDAAAKFKTWDDVNSPNTTVGFNLGTTMEQFVTSELPKAKVRRVESPVRDFQELLAGRVDLTITSLVEGSQLVVEHPNLTMVLQDTPKNSIPLCFMSAIDDLVWLNFLNNWVILRQASGFFDELNDKYKLVLHKG